LVRLKLIDKSALVLFSGGQDSTVSLLWACKNFGHVETVGFNYNQRHLIEMECRKTILIKIREMFPEYKKLLGEDHVIDIPALGLLSETALTRDSQIFIQDNGLPSTFVPGRNLVFFNMASALGWRRNIFNLIGGMCDTDYSGYPDCRRETIDAQANALSLGLDKEVIIHTPLMDMNKSDVWAFSYNLGGDKFHKLLKDDTHTCYIGDRSILHEWGYGCGACPACILRKNGYKKWLKTK
jgi:7-cyano-7-deazaguanine synthase